MAKELTVEQAEKQFLDAKAEAATAWAAVNAYKKEHKLKPGYKPEKDAVGKGYKALIATHKEAKEAREEAEARWKALKPKGTFGRAAGSTVYDYPEGMSSEEKKKFRAAARAAAKKEAKGEAAAAAKKGEDAPAPKKDAPAPKKAKKALKKKAAPVADEDED